MFRNSVKGTALVAMFLPLGFAVGADADMAKCRAISDAAKRVSCYDDLAEVRGAAPTTKTAAGTGKWIVQEQRSPIDDSLGVTALLAASSEHKDRFGRASMPGLIVRCQQNSTDVYINFQEYLGLDETSVLTRIDKQPPVTRTWTLSTDNKAAFAPSAIAFAKSLVGKSTLLAQTTPHGENPMLVTFELAGIDGVVEQVRKACSW